MKCVITGQSLPVWCRIIHNMTHIADGEVYFDFAETIMTITSSNSSVSVISTFLLFKNFFQSYSMKSEQPEKVAIPSKMILKPYRSQKAAKTHERSEIKFAPDADEIIVTSLGKSHVSSTYRIAAASTFVELNLEQDPYQYKNMIKVESKLLSSCLSNFTYAKGLAEITLKIEGDRVTMRNTVSDVTRKDGSVVTEFNFTADDFIEFEVQEEKMEFAFSYREFKLYTTFAEQLKLPVHIHFNTAEDPVFVVVKSENFEARLCLSTRTEDPFDNLHSSSTNSTQSSTGKSSGRISVVASLPSNSELSKRAGPQELIRRRDEDATTEGNGTPLSHQELPPTKRLRRTEAPTPNAMSQSLLLPNNSCNDLNANSADVMEIPPPEAMEEDEHPSSPVYENIGTLVEQMEKKKKSNAFIAIQKLMSKPRMTAAEYLKTIPGHDIVLCPDSDEEA